MVKRIDPSIEATTYSELFEHAKSININDPDLVVYRSQFESRAYAMIARNMAKSQSNESSSALTDEQRTLCDRSIKILQGTAAMVGPAKQQLVFDEPDLTWLRTTSQFKDAFNKKSQEEA